MCFDCVAVLHTIFDCIIQCTSSSIAAGHCCWPLLLYQHKVKGYCDHNVSFIMPWCAELQRHTVTTVRMCVSFANSMQPLKSKDETWSTSIKSKLSLLILMFKALFSSWCFPLWPLLVIQSPVKTELPITDYLSTKQFHLHWQKKEKASFIPT